jgi:hypothetical protein
VGGCARDWLRLIQLQGRHAHLGTRLKPLIGLGALAVDAQLALSHDALDVGEGKLGKAGHQEAIDAHAGFVRLNDERLHAGGEGFLRGCFGVGFW